MPTGGNSKRKYNYIWVSLVILVFGIIFIPKIVDRLKQGEVVSDKRLNKNMGANRLDFIGNDSQRRRVPDFAFLNQDSLLVTNSDYSGKVYIVEFFFTTCPTICPIMTKNLVALQDTFEGEENFGIASFTINPRYDTPTVLKKYAEKNGITAMNWHFLTGNQEAIYDLAEKGFYILANEVEDAPGGFEHSGMFALVDKNGYIRSRKDEFGNPLIYYRGTITEEQGTNAEGETQQITMLKEDIKKLLKE